MDQAAGRALRYGRALLLAVVAVVLGVVAHAMAGGFLPGPVALVGLLAPMVLLNGRLLGGPASRLRLCVLLVVEQTVVHGWLTALGGHAGDPALVTHHPSAAPTASADQLASSLAATSPRVGSLQDVLGATGGAAEPLVLPAWAQHLVADLTGPHAAMALAHVLAAVAVGLWLARGERALWTVLALSAAGLDRLTGARVVRLLASAGRLPTPAPVRPCPRDDDVSLPPRLALCRRPVTHRGPPALLAA